MKQIRRSISYYLRGSALSLSIRLDGRKLRIALGLRVDPDNWTGERARPGTYHGASRTPAAVINSRLNEIEQSLEELFLRHELAETFPNDQQIRHAIDPEKTEADRSFENAFNTFVMEEARRRMWADNTVKSVRQVGAIARAVSPRLRMGQIDRRWLDRFAVWQQSNRLKSPTDRADEAAPEGYANTVIQKHCRIFRWFLRWASEQNLIDPSATAGWRPTLKSVAKPVIFLTEEELMRVWRLDLPEDSPIERARDILCFQSFTGLRYSDAMALRRDAVKADRIEVVTRKTDTLLTIELNSFSRSILKKYAGRRLPDGRALPYMDSSQMNLYVKAVGVMAGIDEPVTVTQYYGARRQSVTRPKHELLSSHAGRRTFICLALAKGIPLTVVMKWTGHTDFASMKPYIDVADRTKSDAMRLLDSLGSGGIRDGETD